MAFKDKQTRKERLSSIVSGDVRDRNRAGPSMIRLNSAATMPRYGMPVSGLRGRAPKDKSRIPVGTIDISGYFGDERTGIRKPTARMPASAVKKAPSSFGKAFAAARKTGQPTFSFGGKSYTTAMKGEARSATKKATGTTRAATGGGKAQSSFGKVFASARAAGKSTFSFGGKSYTTAVKGGGGGGKVTPASARAGTTTTRAQFFGGKSDVAGPRRDSSGRNVSSASGKRK